MYIASTGNVGIGTASPSEKLHVQGNVLINGAAPYISIKTTQTGTPDWKIYNSYNSVGDFAIVGGSSVGNKFNIQPNGNIGIGTTTPAAKFNVQGSGTIGWGNLGNAFILAGSTSYGIGIDSNEIAAKGDNLYFGTISKSQYYNTVLMALMKECA